jgi:putative colanic acid biosynthesis acetyltransferase WcaB
LVHDVELDPVTTMRLRRSAEQIEFLYYELRLIVGRRPWRWFTAWSGASFQGITAYRLDRAGYLLVGTRWSAIRGAFLPIRLMVRPLISTIDIHYRAEIGKGLKVLHPALGVVVSEFTVAGEHLTLTGGNCIGVRAHLKHGEIQIGDKVKLGANAVVLGPVRVGNRVRIGAGAVVVSDAESDAVMIGVPAVSVRDASGASATELVRTAELPITPKDGMG